MQTQVRKASISPVKFAFAFCLSSLGIWLILAEMLVPSLLSDAYQGAGLRPLNRFFASRAVKKPLEYYLKLWTDFEFAIIISGMAYIILIRCIQKSRLTIPIQIASLFTGALFLLLTVLFGPRQDYVAHLQIWKEVITGHDPWWIQPESGIILNAYGPLFNLFAIPAAINPMAPKIILHSFISCFASESWSSIWSRIRCNPDQSGYYLYGFLILPYGWKLYFMVILTYSWQY
jgi:hypothetical protein